MDVEITPRVENDGQGQRQQEPFDVRGVHATHRDRHERQGKKPGHDNPVAQRLEVPGGGGFALFLFLFFTDDKAVAGGFYGGGNLFEGDDGRVVGEQQVFGRKIHNGRLHAPKILYGCLDVVGTHGTTHFEHGKYTFYHTHGTCLS